MICSILGKTFSAHVIATYQNRDWNATESRYSLSANINFSILLLCTVPNLVCCGCIFNECRKGFHSNVEAFLFFSVCEESLGPPLPMTMTAMMICELYALQPTRATFISCRFVHVLQPGSRVRSRLYGQIISRGPKNIIYLRLWHWFACSTFRWIRIPAIQLLTYPGEAHKSILDFILWQSLSSIEVLLPCTEYTAYKRQQQKWHRQQNQAMQNQDSPRPRMAQNNQTENHTSYNSISLAWVMHTFASAIWTL